MFSTHKYHRMEIYKTNFEGLYVIEPKVFPDERGYFFESYNQREIKKEIIGFKPVQDNESKSSKGVIRGLHYQLNPHAQSKLIRVVEGKIFDVAVDLRKDSATYKQWFGKVIDSETKTQLFIPKGFAHGFSVLSDYAIIQYKVDNFYNKKSERGIRFDDPELNIDWKIEGISPIFSEKDLAHPFLSDAEYNF